MKRKSGDSNKVAFVAGLTFILSLTPRSAFAAGLLDASILIPEPSEFFPMLTAFIVVFIAAKKMLWPGVLENFEKRETAVKTSLENAETAQKEAEQISAAYKEKLGELDLIHKQIVDEAKREAEKEAAKIKEQSKADIKVYMAEAKLDIEQQRQQAMVDLTAAAANLSVNMCQKILEEQLDEEKQVQLVERLVQSHLSEVGKSYD